MVKPTVSATESISLLENESRFVAIFHTSVETVEGLNLVILSHTYTDSQIMESKLQKTL
jgi:hypothetical protein